MMKPSGHTYRFLNSISICCFCLFVWADALSQTGTLRSDRSSILIGERFNLELIYNPSGAKAVCLPDIPDSLPHFEFLEPGRWDTIKSDSRYRYHFRAVLTSFDSGQWTIGPFGCKASGKNLVWQSDSMQLNVLYMPEDASGNLRDIKPIIPAGEGKASYWKWICAGLLLLFTGLAFGWYYKTLRRNGSARASGLPPLQKAMEALSDLQGKAPVRYEDARIFHSRLHRIIKTYLAEQDGPQRLADSSSDMLLFLHKAGMPHDALRDLAALLRTGDAVMYAKYHPGAEASLALIEEAKKQLQAMEIIFTSKAV